MIRLETTLPAFRQDLADVIRLFLGDQKITDDEGEPLLHRSRDGAEWIDTVEFRGKTYS